MTKKIITAITVLALCGILAACLFGCVKGASSLSKGADTVKEAGYTVILNLNTKTTDSDKAYAQDTEGVLVATKGFVTNLDYIIAVWYTDSDAAKNHHQDFVDLVTTYTQLTTKEAEACIKTNGSCVYFGSSEDAIKAFEGK